MLRDSRSRASRTRVTKTSRTRRSLLERDETCAGSSRKKKLNKSQQCSVLRYSFSGAKLASFLCAESFHLPKMFFSHATTRPKYKKVSLRDFYNFRVRYNCVRFRNIHFQIFSVILLDFLTTRYNCLVLFYNM